MTENNVTVNEYRDKIKRLDVLGKLIHSEDEDERVAAAREVLQLTSDLQNCRIEVMYE